MKWSDVTVEQFADISELLQEGLTHTDLVLEVGDILIGGVPDDMPVHEFDELKKKIAFVSTPFSATPVQTIKDGENTYSLVRYASLNYAKWIDLDVYLTENSLSEAIAPCAAILYETSEDVIEKLPITEVYGAIQDYIKYRKGVLEKFRGFLLAEDDEEEEDEELEETDEKPVEEEQPSSRAVWLGTVYDLANGDVTKAQDIFKLPHLLVFNWHSIAQGRGSRQQ